MTEEDSITAKIDSLHITSEMDMSLISPEDRGEFLKNLAEKSEKQSDTKNKK